MAQNTQKQASVPASEFTRNFGRYRDQAAAGEIIEVTSHGRLIGGYLSVREIARFEALKRREREILNTRRLPGEIVEAIRKAEYGQAPE